MSTNTFLLVFVNLGKVNTFVLMYSFFFEIKVGKLP